MAEYIGIDYGMGLANIDHETGIRYGVISQHSISSWALSEDMESVYAGPFCPECGNEDLVNAEDMTEAMNEWPVAKYNCADYACGLCEILFGSESAFSEEASGLEYNSDGYTIIDCLITDLMVIASPYYTHAPFCSPCVPGAGDLDSAREDGVRAYCLGHDWFDGDEAPYPVYRVSDDSLVPVPEKEETNA
jgi:hypothetical protein